MPVLGDAFLVGEKIIDVDRDKTEAEQEAERLPDRSERYFSTDLYSSKREEVVRTCQKNCENAFCEFRTAT